MIFTGDIALPFKNGVRLEGIPQDELLKQWVGNLEGSLVTSDEQLYTDRIRRRIVFNDVEAVCELLKKVPFRAFGMANNHLLDACGVRNSLENLVSMNIPQFGAGRNLEEAMRPLMLKDGGREYALYAFGWKSINCIDATDSQPGSNPYNKWHVIDQMQKAVAENPNKRIIAFIHWNTELELYPQPLDRELSHRLIDMGVYAVIGCHAHRVQPFEIYKGHPIVYGLGNFCFRQQTYMDGKLKFPEFSYPEIAFEIDEDCFYVHEFLYDPKIQVVSYQKKNLVTQSNALFASLSDKDYKKWFKENRFQRKGIPISYYEDSRIQVFLKHYYGRSRGAFINMLTRNDKVYNWVKGVAARIFG